MPSWTELLDKFGAVPDLGKAEWLKEQINHSLSEVSRLRGHTNVLFYSSAFLQKPSVPPTMTQLTLEEVNGFMSTMFGMDFNRPLTLMLHTPGGLTNAAETLVSYLRSKFERIEVVIPVYAFSAGTMISLAADVIVMGRQSQLGPIDPQMSFGNRFVSARAVVDQFERAKEEITADQHRALVWAPLLQSIGPSLLQEAQNALDYGERMVAEWLKTYMFQGKENRDELARRAARHFNDASLHKSHGRRIDRTEARSVEIHVEDLEDCQALQESVLTAYHLLTISFEKGPATKVISSNQGTSWVKNQEMQALPFPVNQPPPPMRGENN